MIMGYIHSAGLGSLAQLLQHLADVLLPDRQLEELFGRHPHRFQNGLTPVQRGSVVYQSLPDAEPAATHAAQPSHASELPRADEMTARGTLPELRLELHVWSTKPQERFVFVNGRRYREGDATADGATVEEITREGVIMNSGGNRFLLSRE